MSLFFALSALAGLTLAGVAMMRTADTSALVAGNIGFHGAAVQAADLALEQAAAAIEAMSGSTSHNHNTGAGYYASLSATATDPPAARLSDSNGATLSDAGTGNSLRYVIERMCSATGAPSAAGCVLDGSRTVYRITTLVRGPRNTSEVVQSYVSHYFFDPNCAIMTRGSLAIPGNPRFDGTSRCLFSNTSIDIGGTPHTGFIGDVAAVGSVGQSSKITGAGGTVSPGQPAIAFPTFNTNDYRIYADYIFRSDGRILRVSDNTLLGPYTSSPGWNGWYRETSSPVRWRKGDSGLSPAGLYYFEGNVGVSGSVGSSGSLWNVAFIAEGSIQVSGSCFFQNYMSNPSAPQAVNHIFMMARGDIELNGSSSTAPAVQGLIITNEELKFSGLNKIAGHLIALNANNTDPSGLDNFIDQNEISGDLVLTYTPNALNNLWPALVKRHQWRTVER